MTYGKLLDCAEGYPQSHQSGTRGCSSGSGAEGIPLDLVVAGVKGGPSAPPHHPDEQQNKV